MDRMRRASGLTAVFAGIAGIASGLHPASAQDVTTSSGRQFFVTPYLCLASVHAATLTPLAREPQVNSNVSTIDLLSHLDEAPFMGSFEARYGSLGVLTRRHPPAGQNQDHHARHLFQGGNAALKANTAPGSRSTASSRTRRCRPRFSRLGFSSSISLNPRLLPGVSVNPSGSWTDPLIGARYHRELGKGFALAAYGDVGGYTDLAGARHGRLFRRPGVEPAPRLSQPQLQYYGKRR